MHSNFIDFNQGFPSLDQQGNQQTDNALKPDVQQSTYNQQQEKLEGIQELKSAIKETQEHGKCRQDISWDMKENSKRFWTYVKHKNGILMEYHRSKKPLCDSLTQAEILNQ